MAVTFTFFQCISEDVAEKVHNFDTDTLKVILSNTAPSVSTDTVLSDLTEIASGNGYTSGGVTVSCSTSRTTTTTTITGSDVTVTASGGSIGPFQYAILYNDTSSTDALIGYVNYGTSYTLSNGVGFIVRFGTSLFTISQA